MLIDALSVRKLGRPKIKTGRKNTTWGDIMSKKSEGWLPCTADNEPPEGFRFDVLYNGKALCGPKIPPISWSRRVANGEYWRPAECDGWKLNDGTKRSGEFDFVFRSGNWVTTCELCGSCLTWDVFDRHCSILWWRPAESNVTKEPETKENDMSEVNVGWIECTASNSAPEGFQFDILNRKGDVVLCGDHLDSTSWGCRIQWGNYWRPAACDGWKLNDGTGPEGMVDVVFRCGQVVPGHDAADLSWLIFDDHFSILWWRPTASAVTEESEESELSLLSKLISAQDGYRRTDTRLVEAYEAIRDVMGERDRVIMRHDGDLYLVEWDDAETVSWVQIDEI